MRPNSIYALPESRLETEKHDPSALLFGINPLEMVGGDAVMRQMIM